MVRSAPFSIVDDFAIPAILSAAHVHARTRTWRSIPRRPHPASVARPYRFVSTKSNLPRGLHMPSWGGGEGDYPWTVSQISWYIHERPRLRNARAGCQGARAPAYAVHRLRAPFVRVIIVALFDSNLVLGSFVLIYWAAAACSAIVGTYTLCAVRRSAPSRVCTPSFVYVAHVSKPRPTRPIGGNVKRPRSRS